MNIMILVDEEQIQSFFLGKHYQKLSNLTIFP